MFDTLSIMLLPPLVTIVTGFYIAAMGIHKVTFKAENALFSLICLLWTMISVVFMAKFFVHSRAAVFRIEQLAHFFFAYYPLIHVIFFHRILGRQQDVVTAACLVASVFFSAGVFTPLYMDGLNDYAWGSIAKAGPLVPLFLVYSALVVVYVTWLVYRALKVERNPVRRIKLRYILFSFVAAAILTMLTILPMRGYDLYLPGNFIFIPMGFLGYGLLRYRILGIRTILHMSILWFLSSLVLVIPNALLFYAGWPLVEKLTPPMLFGVLVVLFYVNFHLVVRIQPLINKVFDRNSYDLKKTGLSFFESMMLLKTTPELVNEFRLVVKRTLSFSDVVFYLCSDDERFVNEKGDELSMSPSLVEWLKTAHRPVEGHMVEAGSAGPSIRQELSALFKALKTQFIVPMAQHGNLMAVALLCDKSPDRLLNKDEVRFIDQIGGIVSIALFNSRVYQAITGLKDELEEKTRSLSCEIAIRQEAEEKAKESRARYKLLADNVIDTIWVLDVHKLEITYISPSVYKMVGYTVEEMTGKSLSDFLTPESYAFVLKAQASLLENERVDEHLAISMELEHIRKDGSRVWVEVTGHILNDDKGPLSLIGISRDITDRKRAEKEKKILESRLMQAQKMESIGVLAGGIAHDFNNILMSILGYTQLARIYVPDDNKAAQEKLSRIEKASFRAKDMVSQILAFSRQSEPKILPVQMGPIVVEALKLLKGSLPSTLSIVTDFKDKIRSVLADPVQIHQVVINLCSNAAHAMEDQGGEIRVGLSEIRLEAKDALTMNLPSGFYIRLTVADTGCGMDTKIMERIFDPYFTTKDVGKGSGMGLAVVHGIVVGCGGKIRVASELGKGSTFELLFPAAESIVIEDHDPADRMLKGRERILFVDDEKDIVDMAKEALSAMGYRVTCAGDGNEALRLFTETPDDFDVVITDLTMPGMTGERLAGEIYRMRPQVPVILCTGYNTYFPDGGGRSSGITDILVKPVPAGDMAEAVRNLFDSKEKTKG
jgi:PAS domain S-box-containing protein